MKHVALSVRLQAVVDMVTRGNRVCDVGCDHGFVPIYLVEQGISPRVLAMDARRGPLSAAAGHVEERGLGGVIEARLSDGLHNYNIGEAETLICAGMGGKLIQRILSEQTEKTETFKELILQPQSEVEAFRRFLREQGYRITAEDMVEEDEKFYPMMRVSPRGVEDFYNSELCRLQERYGPLLLRRKSQVLYKYLEREEKVYEGILAELHVQGLDKGKRNKRYREIEILLRECQEAKHIIS